MSQQVYIDQLAHKHSKDESENLEAPGQFLRHYSPDIESYLFSGEISREKLQLKESVLIDFAGTFKDKKTDAKYYVDLSTSGDYLEAVANIYEVLRWAENTDAESILIINLLACQMTLTERSKGQEHIEALFDRIFRATSGREA